MVFCPFPRNKRDRRVKDFGVTIPLSEKYVVQEKNIRLSAAYGSGGLSFIVKK